METTLKLVDFEKYCRDCKYEEEEESIGICNVCLNSPVNENSHKPVEFVKK